MNNSIITNLIINASIDTYPLFSLNGLITYAKLLSNYDGDTGDILLNYNNNQPLRMKARFSGYDSCEIKPSLNDPDRENKKKRAIIAKERLWFLCTNSTNLKENHKTLIKIKCGEFDKYGRLLILAFNIDCNIEDPNLDDKTLFNLSINNQMITEGHGYSYNGGTKIAF